MSSTTFGRYELLEQVRGGPFAELYRARNTSTDRVVALKIVAPNLSDDETFQARFTRESRIAASLSDPHVVPIHDLGEIDGRLFLEMRWIEGQSLQSLIRGPLQPAHAVAIVEQVASALDAAHGAGMVHRDVKPGNILVTDTDFVYLVDFGLARAVESESLTDPGFVIGTFAYMAPERFTGGVVDGRTDVYALTCVLYECLTGQQPYPGDGVEQQIHAHMLSTPPRPSSAADVGSAFDDVIEKGMAKDPNDRYASATELAAAAERALAAQPAGGESAPGAVARVPSAPHPAAVAPSAMPPRVEAPTDYGPYVYPPDYGTPGYGAQPYGTPGYGAQSYGTPGYGAQPYGAAPESQGYTRPGRPASIHVPEPAASDELAAMAPPRESEGDDVDVSVFAPPRVFRGEAFLVQALVHLPEQAADAAALAVEIDPEASRRGVRSLAVPVPDGSVLSIELLLPGLQVDDGVQQLRWMRRAEGIQFEVFVPEDFERRSVLGTLVVSVNGISIGHLKWKVVISPIEGDDPATLAAQGEDAVRYRRAFISYATRDRRDVLQRVQLLKSLGISYFQDVLDLDPGQRWERELFRQIEDCDVFLLFWSDSAKRSDFVRREVDAALRLAEERDPPGRPVLRPVLLGAPVPAPWPELSHLHFNDKLLYFMSG